MKILGIETSCDDTCVAFLDDQTNQHSNLIYSQDHNKFGGILPEYAARNHLEALPNLTKLACIADPDVIAVTYAPGLIGSLMVGTSYAKALAYNLNKPLVQVHHLEGHILSAQYEYAIPFPYGALVVSGGHTLICIAYHLGHYELLGTSLDDSAGECFDKVARELGLPQPGGPAIEKLAQEGTNCIKLPITLHLDKSCNFSFSGLKTATIRAKGTAPDISASLQHTIALILAERMRNAIQIKPEIKNWALVGGVASNRYIFHYLNQVLNSLGCIIYCPSPRLCTDNGLMISYAGKLYAEYGIYSDLDFEPVGSISLSEYSAFRGHSQSSMPRI